MFEPLVGTPTILKRFFALAQFLQPNVDIYYSYYIMTAFFHILTQFVTRPSATPYYSNPKRYMFRLHETATIMHASLLRNLSKEIIRL